jgi:hypothetical protein
MLSVQARCVLRVSLNLKYALLPHTIRVLVFAKQIAMHVTMQERIFLALSKQISEVSFTLITFVFCLESHVLLTRREISQYCFRMRPRQISAHYISL